MKAWILSDLHIDDVEDWDEPIDLGEHPEADVIIMAGDLCDGAYSPVSWLLRTFSDTERQRMIFVPGNHEAYGIGLAKVSDLLRGLRENCGIITLDRQTVEMNGRRFLGCTQWSPLDADLDSMVADINAIPSFDGDKWRRRHERDRAWLLETIQADDVVITHHAPSWEGLAAPMQHNPRLMSFSSGYFADLKPVIADLRPSMWVHGHTHVTRAYEVAGVPVVTNSRGRGVMSAFDPHFVVDI